MSGVGGNDDEEVSGVLSGGGDGPLFEQLSTNSMLSTRVVSQKGVVPTLSSLAARSFVTHVRALSQNERSWAYSKCYLKRLPDVLVPKLFSMLSSSCPALLSHALIVLYFLRGPSLVLSNDLPGVTRQTLGSIVNHTALRELHLVGLDKFSDTIFASIFPLLPHLRILVLRGCSKVGAKTVEAIGKSCQCLTALNLNYTSVPSVSLLGPLTSCTDLEVLKVAGIPSWSDTTFSKLLIALDLILPKMKVLKFRQLGLSDTSVHAFIARCPNLIRLDISFMPLRRLPQFLFTPAAAVQLEKLSLTSTSLSSVEVVDLIRGMPNLRTLYIGALGSIMVPSLTMTDPVLASLTDAMALTLKRLEKLSLIGNNKLGLLLPHYRDEDQDSALAHFIRRVGRRCTYLNLSGISHLRSRDLSGLVSDTIHDDPPRLERLALNNTDIDDNAAPYLACCPSLIALEVAGTKLTSTGLFQIIDACPKLEKLDLTSCRGIKVADRRRFFEVWESERQDV